MIGRFELTYFRGFDSYVLDDLTRVNLLVGPNNSGKTTILEALQLLANHGAPSILFKSTHRRGEALMPSNGQDADGRERDLHDLSHHFHGHRLEEGAWLGVKSDDDLGWIRLAIRQSHNEQSQDLFDFDEGRLQTFVLDISCSAHDSVELAVNDDGSLSLSPDARRTLAARALSPTRPARFLAVDALRSRELVEMWDKVQLEGREAEVVNAMRILEPDLTSIHFLSHRRFRGFGGSPGVLLGLRAGMPRIPMGSHGDGMRRLLGLSLALVDVSNGLLLADEIDTGLHWTAMEDLWRLVVESACQSSLQVFATTHSYDCIRGLASLLQSRPELSDAVSIHKIERSLGSAIPFSGEQIVTAVEQEIELR
ncbi:AAA family ATPase [Candidatus Palauibacter sp.]|uniref:AAA family ATPase n=1 Tax=Candidatus Palauibacter sp. TaxID=3101350 RepID=UPI003C6FCCB7